MDDVKPRTINFKGKEYVAQPAPLSSRGVAMCTGCAFRDGIEDCLDAPQCGPTTHNAPIIWVEADYAKFLRIREVLDSVQYKDRWTLHLKRDGDRPYLQWVFIGPCCITGEVKEQPCRKWQLSYHMTDGELVQTAFAAALAAEEHECREFFKYRQLAVFGPHIKLDALMAVANQIEGRAG